MSPLSLSHSFHGSLSSHYKIHLVVFLSWLLGWSSKSLMAYRKPYGLPLSTPVSAFIAARLLALSTPTMLCLFQFLKRSCHFLPLGLCTSSSSASRSPFSIQLTSVHLSRFSLKDTFSGKLPWLSRMGYVNLPRATQHSVLFSVVEFIHNYFNF